MNEGVDDVNSVEISPQFVKDLDFADGYFLHKKGKISSAWLREDDGSICLNVRIPKGVRAKLRLPSGYICGSYNNENGLLGEGDSSIIIYKK